MANFILFLPPAKSGFYLDLSLYINKKKKQYYTQNEENNSFINNREI